MAQNCPSGLTATLSGCPPSGIVRTMVWVAMSTTSRSPEVSMKLALVLMAQSAKPPVTETAVGSPGSWTKPRPWGSVGSVMSTKPRRSISLSV